MVESTTLFTLGFSLILIGVLIVAAAAIIVMTTQGKKEKKTKTAGIIIIGPVPIIFGSDKKDVKILLALSTAFTMSLIVLLIVYYFLWR